MLLLIALLAVADSARSYHLPVAPAESLRITESGSGVPVVLIPGLFGSAFGFRNVVPLLVQRGYRVIVIEPLGIGSSGRPRRADYSLAAQADRIAAVLDSLDLTGVVVVGHSVGASIAYRVAYRRPGRVGALISLDGGPTEAATTASFRRAMRFAPWIKWLGGIKLVRKKIRSGLIEASGNGTWVTDQVIEGYTAGAAADLDGTLHAFLRMAAAKEPEKLVTRLRDVRCPVLLLVGGAPHESALPGREVKLMYDSLPSFAVDTIPGAGHYLHEERPEAVVNAVVSVGLPQPPSPAIVTSLVSWNR